MPHDAVKMLFSGPQKDGIYGVRVTNKPGASKTILDNISSERVKELKGHLSLIKCPISAHTGQLDV